MSEEPRSEPEEFFGEVISVYTREAAIEDGVLIDVSETAAEAGFQLPTVVTQGVWAEAVGLPEGYVGTQDERGRLWDVLSVARLALGPKPTGQRFDYKLNVAGVPGTNHPHRHVVELYLLIGPGDEGEPVLTVLLRGED